MTSSQGTTKSTSSSSGAGKGAGGSSSSTLPKLPSLQPGAIARSAGTGTGNTHISGGTSSSSCASSTKTTHRRVIRGRAMFVGILLAVAVSLGTAAYFLIANGEENLASTEYHSLSERAMKTAQEITLRKRLGTVTMAKIASSLHPLAESWPYVTIPGYEVTTQNLIATSNGREMGFCPLVKPAQLKEFETFAYEYYYEKRFPKPFPNTTALSANFGRGIWGKNASNGERYHEVDGTTSWGSKREIVTPILHHNLGNFPALMLNLHFQETRGIMIDAMMDCAEEKEEQKQDETETQETECGGITDMIELTSQKEGTGPGALIMQPIYATSNSTASTTTDNDNSNSKLLVGLIASSIVWDETLVDVFASSVSGIDCVLKTSHGTTYTYTIQNGIATVKGEGDLHNNQYNHYRLSIDLTPSGTFSAASPIYTLYIYPNDTFFDTFTTHSPCFASAAVVATLLLTSFFFLSYDFCVQKDLHAKQELLAAKRNFLRFISHEVRTPLNAVCMGLGMLEEEIRNTLSSKEEKKAHDAENRQEEGEEEETKPHFTTTTTVGGGAPPPTTLTTTAPDDTTSIKQDTLSDWLCLTQDVLHSAQNSVDVLSDILNYDKVENGSLSLELTIVPIWELIHQTVQEFKLSAASKQINLNLVLHEEEEKTRNNCGIVGVGSPKLLSPQAQNQCVIGDSVRITQVVRNLVSNAIKFTPEQGDIFIRAKWRTISDNLPNTSTSVKHVLSSGEEIQAESSGCIELTVTDTGEGMNSEQLKLLFSSGVQFNVNKLQKGQGSGLGLFISKGIVNSHGGSLEASSPGIGHGTTFELVLPMVRLPPPAPPSPSLCHPFVEVGRKVEVDLLLETTKEVRTGSNDTNSSHDSQDEEPIQLGVSTTVNDNNDSYTLNCRPSAPTKSPSLMSVTSSSGAGVFSKKILVVDDAPINRKLLVKLLKRRGHECNEACDGKECVDKIVEAMEEGTRYDTVLLDYQMPVMDGPEAASEIRKLGCDSFIVGLTGNILPEDKMYFKSRGADAVLPKPFELPALESLWMEYGIDRGIITPMDASMSHHA